MAGLMPGFALVPAAITMVAGPQIISAVVLATSHEARRNSLAFLAGVTAAVLLGTLAAIGLAKAFGGGGQSGSSGPTPVDYTLAALLAFVAVRAFLKRKDSEPPKWMTGLQQAQRRQSLRLGFLLFLLMPTDIAMMLSVGRYLTKRGLDVTHALPFFALTLLLASLPFLALLLFGDKGMRALPRVRDWMNSYSWAINIGICAYFIYSLLK